MNADGSPSEYDPTNPDPLHTVFSAAWLMRQTFDGPPEVFPSMEEGWWK